MLRGAADANLGSLQHVAALLSILNIRVIIWLSRGQKEASSARRRTVVRVRIYHSGDTSHPANMADLLTDEQIGEIIDAFNAVDDDNDGVINANQLGRVLKLLGENPTVADLQDMVNDVDSDGSGSIEFPELLMMMAKKISDLGLEDEIREAFRVFDRVSDQLANLTAKVKHPFNKNVRSTYTL
jgi:hypothetical protein